jgi:hypothetical protein
MDFNWLKSVVGVESFTVEILPGRYNLCESIFKTTVKLFLNGLISVLSSEGTLVAPDYLLVAQPKPRGDAVESAQNAARRNEPGKE